MSSINTTQIKTPLCEMTFRYDVERTRELMRQYFDQLARDYSGPERGFAVADHLTQRAAALFAKNMHAQLEAATSRLLTDAMATAVEDFAGRQPPRLFPAKEARAFQADVRKLRAAVSEQATRDVWGTPGQGRPGVFTENELESAIKKRGVGARKEDVAKDLSVDESAIRRRIKEMGFENWKDAVRRLHDQEPS